MAAVEFKVREGSNLTFQFNQINSFVIKELKLFRETKPLIAFEKLFYDSFREEAYLILCKILEEKEDCVDTVRWLWESDCGKEIQ